MDGKIYRHTGREISNFKEKGLRENFNENAVKALIGFNNLHNPLLPLSNC